VKPQLAGEVEQRAAEDNAAFRADEGGLFGPRRRAPNEIGNPAIRQARSTL
jgi:hypothetical protein